MKMFLQTSWPLEGNREIVVQRFPFVIGRRSDSDCSLSLAFVSRRHCQFTRTGDKVLVQDLESYNGTFVNGNRANSPLPVSHGDELKIGPCTFRVSVEHDTAERPVLASGLAIADAPAARPSHSDDASTLNSEGGPYPQLTPGGCEN